VILGFYEDVENHRFGVKPKRGMPKPGSDFHFEFVLKVVASHPASTGFLVRVFTEVTASSLSSAWIRLCPSYLLYDDSNSMMYFYPHLMVIFIPPSE